MRSKLTGIWLIQRKIGNIYVPWCALCSKSWIEWKTQLKKRSGEKLRELASKKVQHFKTLRFRRALIIIPTSSAPECPRVSCFIFHFSASFSHFAVARSLHTTAATSMASQIYIFFRYVNPMCVRERAGDFLLFSEAIADALLCRSASTENI